MRIGELSRATGASVRSLRYYEGLGLLEARRAGTGAHRDFDRDAISRVRVLRQMYAAGLSSAAIATIMPCVDAPTTGTTLDSISVSCRRSAIG
ncbi:hypothetical protein CH253_19085 [Rhodococcus sp. 06-156-3C]|uniref:MerR family transcriptional regulator n=1 Tax=Nocardiaceae TaxID=85025 RepID=UPI0009B8BD3F|nr:hypothetical protein CH248_28555 [Rhodococcus sp. 06-156-4a]OZD18026.1 hypothetical protein CH253_19085 [Rhodococcus sp. 06-156-3C]OZD20414.1 hypothetical protein CH280_04510 [Rhodococcus sp. 06-156-4C]OZD29258.1 hypothetical protein CH284_27365 [Rhodococcus sp. 06-156-3]OZD30530.1 hypothetical protein CH247_14490 [Rhodococcus sp. 06-156-3b]OZF64892.1 hypothetical protein CH290_09815 [Rhodococcus sp. 06-156-4]